MGGVPWSYFDLCPTLMCSIASTRASPPTYQRASSSHTSHCMRVKGGGGGKRTQKTAPAQPTSTIIIAYFNPRMSFLAFVNPWAQFMKRWSRCQKKKTCDIQNKIATHARHERDAPLLLLFPRDMQLIEGVCAELKHRSSDEFQWQTYMGGGRRRGRRRFKLNSWTPC